MTRKTTADRIGDITNSTTTDKTCDRSTSITKTLLAYGVIVGPIYVVTSVVQGLLRPGFDFARHPWSVLANGDLGWIQVLNFILAGAMTIALAVGLRRALAPGRASTWAPRLVAVYGASLVAAGVFRADPMPGFPPGTPEPTGTVEMSWHGMLHFVAGAIGFSCLIAACFVVARRFKDDGRRVRAATAGITGIIFAAGFVGVAAGAGHPIANVSFGVAVVLVWIWISATSAHLYSKISDK